MAGFVHLFRVSKEGGWEDGQISNADIAESGSKARPSASGRLDGYFTGPDDPSLSERRADSLVCDKRQREKWLPV